MKAIEVNHLSKSFRTKIKEKGLKGSLKSILRPQYRTVTAVDDVSFSVEEGEMIALWSNGAEKVPP
jgi:ABC-2 type transport system ATP-binding protein